MKKTGVILGIWLSCSLFAIALAAKVNSECRTENFRGTCIPLPQCPRLFELWSNPRPLRRSIIRILRAADCGSENRQPLVCCRNEVTPTRVITRVQPEMNTAIDVSNHRNVDLINPDLCGQISAGRIANGNITELFEMPWMVMLKYQSKIGTRTIESFKCGGTLINRRYVLTAAHCLNIRLVSVRLGEHDTSTEQDCELIADVRVCAPPPQNINVESYVKHPGYSASALRDDIGLIRLAEPADVDKNTIQPICLPVGAAEQNKNFYRKKLIVAGWGLTERDVASPVLLKVSVPVVSTENCQAKFSRYNLNITGGSQLCAGDSKYDSCGGDSGGPLKTYGVFRSAVSMVQYGVVSFGYRFCGRQTINDTVPGVYTRVGHYMKWILDNMEP